MCCTFVVQFLSINYSSINNDNFSDWKMLPHCIGSTYVFINIIISISISMRNHSSNNHWLTHNGEHNWICTIQGKKWSWIEGPNVGMLIMDVVIGTSSPLSSNNVIHVSRTYNVWQNLSFLMGIDTLIFKSDVPLVYVN